MSKEKKNGMDEWETLARSLKEIEEKQETDDTKPSRRRGRTVNKGETGNKTKEAAMKKTTKASKPKVADEPDVQGPEPELEQDSVNEVPKKKVKVKKENVAKPKKKVKKASVKKVSSKKKTVEEPNPFPDLLSQLEQLSEEKGKNLCSSEDSEQDSFDEADNVFSSSAPCDRKYDDRSDNSVFNVIENVDQISLDDFFSEDEDDSVLDISWGKPPRRASKKDDLEVQVEDFEEVVFSNGDEVEVLVSVTTSADIDDEETDDFESEEDSPKEKVKESRSRRNNRKRHSRRNAEEKVAENSSDEFNPLDLSKEVSLDDFFASDDEGLEIDWGKKPVSSEKTLEQKAPCAGSKEIVSTDTDSLRDRRREDRKDDRRDNRREDRRDDRRDNRQEDRKDDRRDNRQEDRKDDRRDNRREDRKDNRRDNRREDRKDDRRDNRREDRKDDRRDKDMFPMEDNRNVDSAPKGTDSGDRSGKRRISEKQNLSSDDRNFEEDRDDKMLPSWNDAISLVVRNNMARHNSSKKDSNRKKR